MKHFRSQAQWPLTLFICLILSACGGSNGGSSGGSPEILDSLAPNPNSIDRSEPIQTQVLLLTGGGTRDSENQALQSMLNQRSLTFRVVSFTELNSVSQEDLAQFGVILWPGGNFSQQTRALTVQTRERLKYAITQNGVGFLGLGAGAWAAGSKSSGLGLVQERLSVFEPRSRGKSGTQVSIAFPDGSTRTLAWREGPELGSWGNVMGRYPDGKTAVAEGRAGKAHVLLSGPEPQGAITQRNRNSQPTEKNLDLAYNWIQAVLNPSHP
jgi:hypothetical protein